MLRAPCQRQTGRSRPAPPQHGFLKFPCSFNFGPLHVKRSLDPAPGIRRKCDRRG